MPIMHPDFDLKDYVLPGTERWRKRYNQRLSPDEMTKHLALNEASRIEHEAASKRTLIITALAIGFGFVLWRQS